MKFAAAMKYGGELVSATECDYDSFKQLVPLCPECKEPVYLRAGCDRISPKGKEYKVPKHWSHFAGKSAEQIAACESRVNGYTEKDRQRIAAQARGQRLKLLQRWFWKVVQESPLVKKFYDGWEYEQYPELAELLANKFVNGTKKMQKEDLTQKVLSAINKHNEAIELALDDVESFGFFCIFGEWFDLKPFMRILNLDLHAKITYEVIDFLTTSRVRPVLAILSEATWRRLGGFKELHFEEEKEAVKREKEILGSFIPAMIEALVMVDWSAEFERLKEHN